MKRIFTLALVFATLAIGCKKDDTPAAPKEPAAYGVSTDDATFYELTYGKKKSVNFYISSRNGYVDANNVKITVKADPSLVAQYNQKNNAKALALPENAVSFSTKELQIYKNNKKSLAATVSAEMFMEMEDTLYVLPVTIESISGSETAKIADDAPLFLAFRKLHQDIDKGKGTQKEPYLIYDAKDLEDMHDLLVAETDAPDGATYFKMMKDVTMNIARDDEVTWEPLNTGYSKDGTTVYDKKINFNGNGHTIKGFVCVGHKYSSMFGVIYGEVYDVTFDGAYIEGTEAMGTLGGYCGTTNVPAYVHDVKVINSELFCTGGSKNGCGGIAGRAAEATIERCYFQGEIDSEKNFCGGILGHDAGANVIVKNCMTEGRINHLMFESGHSGGQRVGGILGGFTKTEANGTNSKVLNCITTMGVCGRACVGGIVGHANGDKWPDQNPHNEVSGCIAWCDSLSARMTSVSTASSGAIVAYTSVTNTLAKCYYKAGLKVFYDNEDVAEFFKFVDQPDANAGSPLTEGINSDGSNVFRSFYNGKSAGAGETASAVAKKIGWDESVWDLSGNIPALK